MPRAASIYYTLYDGGARGDEHPPLILIHGAGGSRLQWPAELRRMPGQRVYTLDLPGHGKSGGDGEGTIEGYMAHVLEWMEALDLSPAVLVGHSMGGAIALSAGLEAADMVAGLVLVGTGGRLRVHPSVLELTAKVDSPDQVVDLVIGWAFGQDADPQTKKRARARMAEIGPQVLRQDFAACDGFDVLDRLSAVTAPALVVCGTEDKLTPAKYSFFLADSISGAQLELVDGAGHMVMLERPELVAGAVARFIEGFVEGRR